MLCSFDLICRLCTNQSTDLQPISGAVLTKQVLQCTSVQIVVGDGLPDTICQACLTRLSNAYEFRLQCQQSDTHLRQQLSYEALNNSEISDDMRIFECHTSNELEVKYKAPLFDILYTESAADVDQDLEYAQMQIVDGNDVTTIKRVNHGKSEKQRKSNIENYPDFDITVGESNLLHQVQVLSYPTNRVKRKKRRVELKPVQPDLFTDIEVEQNDDKILEEREPFIRKKYPVKSKQCHVCGKVCKCLASHMLTHTGVRRYVCEYCTKSFKQLSHYNNHINIHTGNKPYACTMCDKRFHDPSLKRSHIIVAHTRERNYKCNICEKTFGHSRTLLAHKKTHTQDRRHICSICTKPFLTRTDLKNHFRTHTGEKPYKCDMCDKKFSTSKNIQSHRRTHRERP